MGTKAQKKLACYFNYTTYKTTKMKQALQRILKAENGTEMFHNLATVFMILLFIAFWGVSFYVLVSSFA